MSVNSGGSHPLDQQEIEQLNAELAEAREQVSILKAQSKQHLRDYKASVEHLARQLDEAARRREEDGRHLLKLFKDREHDRDQMAWLGGQVQTLRGLCDGIVRMDGYDPETAHVTVREIRRIIDMEPAAVPLVTDWDMPAQVVQLQCLENVERCATEGCTNAKTGWGVCEPVDAVPQPADAEMAHIEARFAEDERVFTAVGAAVAEIRGLTHITPAARELMAAWEARAAGRALTGEQKEGAS